MNEASYIERLNSQIDDVEKVFEEILKNSSIYYHDINDRHSGLVFIGWNNWHWGDKDEKNQIRAKEKYLKFYQNFELLLDKASPNTLREINKCNKYIINLLEQNDAPSSIENGRKEFLDYMRVFRSFLDLLNGVEKRTVIVPDTNTIAQFPDPSSYKSISLNEKYDFVLLPTVLSELDKQKVNHRNEEYRKRVISVVKRLKGYRKQGDVLKGITVDRTITVKMVATEPNFDKTLKWLDSENNDDRIIANALELQVSIPGDNVVLVTSDINLQNKAQLANLTVLDTDELINQ